MGKIVLVDLCHLQTFCCTYEQFISVLWNVFFIGNVRKSVWNSALEVQSYYVTACWTDQTSPTLDPGL